MNRSIFVDRLVSNLLKHDYEVLLTKGCFDIAAKKEKLMLIKLLANIDGLNPEHAKSLRAVAYFMSAYPFVVSMKTNRAFLADNMIYSRFGLAVMTPRMFDSMIDEDAQSTLAAKGRHSVEINAELLREVRYKMKFTLQELAELVGISKKALYEIESRRTNPTERTVKRLEMMLKIELRKAYEPKAPEKTTMEAHEPLQHKVSKELDRIGVENSPVRHAPFDIVGKEDFSLITGLSSNTKKIMHVADSVKHMSKLFGASAFFVSNRKKSFSVEGLPVLSEDELPGVETPKQLKKLIDETSD